MKKITFIGCGNMSSAIIRGMLQAALRQNASAQPPVLMNP